MLQWVMLKLHTERERFHIEVDPFATMKQTMRDAADLLDKQQEEIERLQSANRALYNYLNEVREHGEVWGD